MAALCCIQPRFQEIQCDFILEDRIREYGLEGKPIQTYFDLLDFDEGRDPVAAQAWRS